MNNPQIETDLEKIRSESLKKILVEILEQQKITNTRLTKLETDINAWGTWLRTGSGAIIFIVSVSFLGVLIGLLLPISLNLWRNSV